jgi:hypothetical protein
VSVTQSVALIDYGAGNLQSVRNALKAAGGRCRYSRDGDPTWCARQSAIVLPGVGAFAHCKQALWGIDGMIEALDGEHVARAACRSSASAWGCSCWPKRARSMAAMKGWAGSAARCG